MIIPSTANETIYIYIYMSFDIKSFNLLCLGTFLASGFVVFKSVFHTINVPLCFKIGRISSHLNIPNPATIHTREIFCVLNEYFD
jgi:hypothetical protein